MMFCGVKRETFVFFTGSALKCYRCESTKSWAECNDSAKNVITCSAGLSRCGKVFKRADQISTFARGCLSAKQCHDGPEHFEICRKTQERGSKVTCQMSCCSSDLCNGAAHVSVVRVLTLLTCALVATVVYVSNIWRFIISRLTSSESQYFSSIKPDTILKDPLIFLWRSRLKNVKMNKIKKLVIDLPFDEDAKQR